MSAPVRTCCDCGVIDDTWVSRCTLNHRTWLHATPNQPATTLYESAQLISVQADGRCVRCALVARSAVV